GLSRSVASHQRDNLTAAQCQRDSLDGGYAVVAMVQVVGLADDRPPPRPSPAGGGMRFRSGQSLGINAGVAKTEWDRCPTRPERQVDHRRSRSAFGKRD